jgi:hypothetical protein
MGKSNTANKSSNDLLESGAELVATLTGVAVGQAITGHAGEYAGAIVGPIICRLLQEFSKRRLGRREKERLGAIVIFAIQKIEANFVVGNHIRSDDFFTDQPDGRSSAEEIAEGVLTVSQREYEERKIRFYGNLLGNLAS